MLNIIIAEYCFDFLKFLLCLSELFFLLFSPPPAQKLYSTALKQLQRLSAENLNNINLVQEECALATVGQQLQTDTCYPLPT